MLTQHWFITVKGGVQEWKWLIWECVVGERVHVTLVSVCVWGGEGDWSETTGLDNECEIVQVIHELEHQQKTVQR